jgi:hypothetical protein
MAMINKFLDQKFKKNKRISLEQLVAPTKRGTIMRSGTLVVMASGDRKLRLLILEKDTPHKGFSEPLPMNSYARQHRVTPNYLLWYLSFEPVRDYLVSHATGSLILRVPRKTLYSLPIPLPSRKVNVKEVSEVVIGKASDSFSNLIDAFYKDYILNFTGGRFRTAIILAGAISEVILYQLLLEQDVNPKILSNDRNLALSKMLDYVRLLKLDQAENFPMVHLIELQKKRNAAIHAGLLIRDQRVLSRDDLVCFDHIIKHFGI